MFTGSNLFAAVPARECVLFHSYRIIVNKAHSPKHAPGAENTEDKMKRTDLYVKVELDYDDDEKPERLATEICRVIRRVYGVRKVEVSSMIERDN
jgi:hypothetical protein